MEKEFVPYDLALRMKALGFDEPCFGLYENGKIGYSWATSQCTVTPIVYRTNSNFVENILSKDDCTAPTFSQAFSWFREKYDLFPIVQPYFPSNKLTWNIIFMDNFSVNIGDGEGEYVESEIIGSYEEAELACLNKLIEIVKEKL